MLRDNSFPVEKSRRWILAKLLQIPPILMGVNSIDELLPQTKHKSNSYHPPTYQTLPTQHTFEMSEYRQALRKYWQTNHTLTARGVLEEIAQRMSSLEQETLYGKWHEKQRRQIVHVLCGYHMVFANVARDQEWYNLAIFHLNKGYQLAKNYELTDMQAAILYRRGGVFEDQGCGYENVLDVASARRCFSWAENDFRAAKGLANYLYAGLQGCIQVSLGLTLAHLASNPSQLHLALVEIRNAEKFAGKDENKEDVHFVRLDEERYHLDVASAYISAQINGACYPRDARRELFNARAAQPTPIPKRREAYNMVLEAKSYLIEGKAQDARKKPGLATDAYMQATTIASQALSLVVAIKSEVNLSRIKHLCREMVGTEFGKKSVELASLEVQITASEYPQMFQ